KCPTLLLLQIQPDWQGVRHPHGPAILHTRRPFAAALQYADSGGTCVITQIPDNFHIRKASIAFDDKRNLQQAGDTCFYRFLRKFVILTYIFHESAHAAWRLWAYLSFDKHNIGVPWQHVGSGL